MNKMVRQGDILLERVDVQANEVNGKEIGREADGAVVLAHGEVTGHRHAFYGGNVALFRDDALARDMQDPQLYIGHLKIGGEAADLKHEEHGTIRLEPGVYRVRRQREYDAGMARLVAD